jgi:hypothetical protein
MAIPSLAVGTHFELVTRRAVGFKGISIFGHTSQSTVELRGHAAIWSAITLPEEDY